MIAIKCLRAADFTSVFLAASARRHGLNEESGKGCLKGLNPTLTVQLATAISVIFDYVIN